MNLETFVGDAKQYLHLLRDPTLPLEQQILLRHTALQEAEAVAALQIPYGSHAEERYYAMQLQEAVVKATQHITAAIEQQFWNYYHAISERTFGVDTKQKAIGALYGQYMRFRKKLNPSEREKNRVAVLELYCSFVESMLELDNEFDRHVLEWETAINTYAQQTKPSVAVVRAFDAAVAELHAFKQDYEVVLGKYCGKLPGKGFKWQNRAQEKLRALHRAGHLPTKRSRAVKVAGLVLGTAAVYTITNFEFVKVLVSDVIDYVKELF